MKRIGLSISVALLSAATANAGELRVGAAAVVITPPPGTPMAGYYSARGADGVLDDLYGKALVLEHDGVRAAVVVCDLISLPRHTVVAARTLIEQRTGIPGGHVLISATHTHTGPVVYRESARDQLDGGASELGMRYSEGLPELIARSVAEASGKLTPVRIAGAVGREEHLSYNRRFRMRDGSVGWNPPKLSPQVVRPAGPIDPDVGVLTFDAAPNQPVATFVNFAMHPDTTGGTKISADYPGALARLLAETRGPAALTVFANGACGNLNHRDIQWADRQSGPAEAKRIGTVLAGAVCRTLSRLQPLPAGALKVRSENVKLPLPPISQEEITKAHEVVKHINDPKTKFLEKVKAYQVLDVAAREGKPWEVEVQVIALGDRVAWVSLPGEIFVELGLAVKKGSRFPFTMIAELANGSVGYVPNRPAYAEGNYEVVSARCAEGSGELLVEAALRLLGELYPSGVGE
jgi:hypothetical protein